MRKSWGEFFRRIASVCMFAVAGSVAWTSAVNYALAAAYDDPNDPTGNDYADGWQEGDNGGSGFTPWNFDSAFYWTVDHNWYPYNTDYNLFGIDDGQQNGTQFSNPFNQIGKAWALGETFDTEGAVRAGRGFDPLQVGQTLRVVVDNPPADTFFKGYFIRLNGGTGGVNGNICNDAGRSCTPMAPIPAPQLNVSMFVYGSDPNSRDSFNHHWGVTGSSFVSTPLEDLDTTAGMQIDVLVTATDLYQVTMTPLDDPNSAFITTGSFGDPNDPDVPVDWIEFTFFNSSPTDDGTPPTLNTDFYIRSMQIFDPVALEDADFDNNDVVDGIDFLTWQRGFGTDAGTGNVASHAAGNANGDRFINGADLAIWESQYGGSPLLATVAVPEPACGLLMLLGAGYLLRRGPPRGNLP